MKDLVPREGYAQWLRRWRDKDVIKVVSGVRRCGKSTLLSMFRDELLADGLDPRRAISINLEDVSNEWLTDYRRLHSYVLERLKDGEQTYVFLDEVQHVDGFERVLDSLHARPGCDLYVTGSNAYLLSNELATLLTGRYVELKMLPLSFSEFCLGLEGASGADPTAWGASARDAAFATYLAVGGFPFVLGLLDDGASAMEYLHDVYQSILYKDIVARMKVGEPAVLERVGKTLASEVGSLVSVNRIANTLRSGGMKADQKTVDKYMDGFTESMLFYEAPRWDIKGRRLLSRIAKYYIVDTGLRRNLVQGSSNDLGHLLENVVYLELRRRFRDVCVGSIDEGEVDFVVAGGDEVGYFQVAASVLDPQTLERELAAFRRVKDNHPKTLLTLDRVLPASSLDGVVVGNAVDWLLGMEPSRP